MERVLANFLTWITISLYLALEIHCATSRIASLAMTILSLLQVEGEQYVVASIDYRLNSNCGTS